MDNLFSIFDPSTSSFLSLNWLSLGLFKIMFVSVYFNSEMLLGFNRFNKLTSSLVDTLYTEFKIPMAGKIVPCSLMFFIWMFAFCCSMNFMGLTPYTFTPSSNISLTLAMAFCVWFLVDMGFAFKSMKSFLAHLVPSGTPSVLIPLMVVIELVSNFIRPITLSVRLAANMVAGHLLISLVNGGSMTLVAAPMVIFSGILLMALEISVAFIQGYVFSTLSVMYFSELNMTLAANKS